MKYYLNSRLLLMGLTSLLLLTTITSGIVFASSSNWVEVARWSGSAFPDPQDFDKRVECDHVEWRVRWSYQAVGSSFESVLLIHKDGELFIYSEGYSSKDGVRNIHNEKGNFSLSVLCINIYEYTIIVEQDLNSIPEFPSWIILPLFLTATVFALIFRKRLFRIIS